MNLQELLLRMSLAFGIGLLIGLERAWRTRTAAPGSRAAGVRTFTLTGLLGGVIAALARDRSGDLDIKGSILLGAAFIAYAVVIAFFNRDENKASNSHSATTTVAALVTFALGAYAMIGDERIAAAAAVASAGVLLIRNELHGWIAKITLVELQSGLVLLAMTFIALPVVPNEPIDALAQVNPREIWLIAIVLATVSFVGYIAVKLYGESRGILIAAAAGGLVSSTAVTYSFAKRAKAGEGAPDLLAAGATLATGVSLLRVGGIVLLIEPAVARALAPTLLVALVVSSTFAIWMMRSAATAPVSADLFQFKNPFKFAPVVIMAVTMGVLVIVGRWIEERFGSQGAIAAAAAMGMFDVDAMTVSMTRLTPAALTLYDGTIAISVGVATNIVSKTFLAVLGGNGIFARRYALAAFASIAAAGLTVFFIGA